MIEPSGITMISSEKARVIAEDNRAFDLFDPPTDTEDAVAPPPDARFRPIAIALTGIDSGADDSDRWKDAVLVWGHQRLRTITPETMIPAILIKRARAGMPGLEAADGAAAETARESTVDEEDLLLLALAMERRPGRYSWAELDRICAFAASLERRGRCVSPGGVRFEERLAEYLDPDRDSCPLLARYRQLPAALQEALERRQVDMRTAERVATIGPTFLPDLLAAGTSLSFSRRRQFLTACADLLRRGADGRELIRTLREAEPDHRFDLVMEQRYPRLLRMRNAVERVRKTTLRGTGITLEPPPSFEGDRYRISFEVRSTTELKKRLLAARKLEKELDELLGILFQDDFDDLLAR